MKYSMISLVHLIHLSRLHPSEHYIAERFSSVSLNTHKMKFSAHLSFHFKNYFKSNILNIHSYILNKAGMTKRVFTSKISLNVILNICFIYILNKAVMIKKVFTSKITLDVIF